jgi:hypothetical protein
MENRKDILIRVLFGLLVLGVLLIVAIIKPNSTTQLSTTNNICKEDSLQKVVDELQMEIQNEEDGWDKKERRYEEILFEYEFGLDRLKNYHPEAYKDFHRIIGYKENYSHETERENKKRLKIDKW